MTGDGEMVLVRDIPGNVVESACSAIAEYSVAFLVAPDLSAPHTSGLLGTGVLIKAAGRHAILTADHVAQLLPNSGRIPIFLERTSQVHTFDSAGASYVRVGRGRVEAIGPDLAVVVVAPVIAGSLEAKRPFFNLEAHRQRLLDAPPDLTDGFWLVQGFPEERIVVTSDPVEQGLTKYFCNFSGIGRPDVREVRDGYDYFDYPIDSVARAEAPVRWGGMSGGGIWQVPLQRRPDGLSHGRPVLMGLMFYQYPSNEAARGIRGHGTTSIYDTAYAVLAGS